MKLKNIVFACFVLTFLSINTFCMDQEKFGCEKEVEKCEKETEKKLTTRGLKLMNSFKASLKSGMSEEDVDTTLSNVIRFCLFEVKYKIKVISDSLQEMPVIGKAIKYSGIGMVITYFSPNIASLIFNVDKTIKESEEIKNEIKETLKKEPFENKDKELNKCAWYNRKIDFKEEKSGLKVKFLDSDFKTLESFEKDSPETCDELLCFGVEIARRKEFLTNTFDRAKTPGFLHNLLHEQLSGNVTEIEGKIRKLFFPGEESKGK
jgi:hypothetical protein